MPARNLLLVLIVGEVGLRSTLAARLVLTGADLVTAGSFHDPVIARSVRQPATLVVDGKTLASQEPDWVTHLLAQDRWQRVVLLDGVYATQPANDRLVVVEGEDKATKLVSLVAGWRADLSSEGTIPPRTQS